MVNLTFCGSLNDYENYIRISASNLNNRSELMSVCILKHKVIQVARPHIGAGLQFYNTKDRLSNHPVNPPL